MARFVFTILAAAACLQNGIALPHGSNNNNGVVERQFGGPGGPPSGSFSDGPRPTGTPTGGFPGFPSGPGGPPTGIPTGFPTGAPTGIPSGFPTGAPEFPEPPAQKHRRAIPDLLNARQEGGGDQPQPTGPPPTGIPTGIPSGFPTGIPSGFPTGGPGPVPTGGHGGPPPSGFPTGGPGPVPTGGFGGAQGF